VLRKGNQELKEEKKGLFGRLRERLSKTRETFVSKIDRLVQGKKEVNEELLEELEEILITSDLGVETTIRLVENIREQIKSQVISRPGSIKDFIREEILQFLSIDAPSLDIHRTRPFVIMVIGVNGVGKTTTIGKMAHKFKERGESSILVAADTFRAAAIEQLEIWGTRVGAEVVKQMSGSDPAAVAFDAIKAAKSRDMDLVIIDTAGRLHTKVGLMEELKKIKRVISREIEDAPHEVLLVLDATTGQNAISQVKLFHEALDVTGIALTKLDGTAKGGIVVGICHQFNIPIRYIGIGERVDDLREFNPREFVRALF
jgi:fused signal recognition particle receptor